MIQLRRSEERGHAHHGWLEARHTFSFADYYDPAHKGFSVLRVINEDRVQPGMGFSTHAHQDMEIITYILAGALEHKDSMGNGSVIRPGEVQYMSAGSGVTHSEFNHSKEESVHLLQIWIRPEVLNQTPRYAQQMFSEAERKNLWRLICSPDGALKSIAIRQQARVYASLLDATKSLSMDLTASRSYWLHLARGELTVNDQKLKSGDALSFSKESRLMVTASENSEILLFDLP